MFNKHGKVNDVYRNINRFPFFSIFFHFFSFFPFFFIFFHFYIRIEYFHFLQNRILSLSLLQVVSYSRYFFYRLGFSVRAFRLNIFAFFTGNGQWRKWTTKESKGSFPVRLYLDVESRVKMDTKEMDFRVKFVIIDRHSNVGRRFGCFKRKLNEFFTFLGLFIFCRST